MTEKENVKDNGGFGYPLLGDVAIQEKVLLLLERLHGYLDSGSTYCFDNQWDEADAEELKELIERIRGNVA